MFTANTKKFLCIESFIRFYFQIAAMLFEYEQILFMHALQEHYYCAVLYIYATDISIQSLYKYVKHIIFYYAEIIIL